MDLLNGWLDGMVKVGVYLFCAGIILRAYFFVDSWLDRRLMARIERDGK